MANERGANPKAGVPGEASGVTILLADDEAEIRYLVMQVLQTHGYTVLEAADGVDALEVAEHHLGPIHLLLTDWCMPRLDGGGLIRRLSDRRPETAILVMSGYMDVEAPPKAAVLRKPFNSQDLVYKVSKALGSMRNSTPATEMRFPMKSAASDASNRGAGSPIPNHPKID